MEGLDEFVGGILVHLHLSGDHDENTSWNGAWVSIDGGKFVLDLEGELITRNLLQFDRSFALIFP